MEFNLAPSLPNFFFLLSYSAPNFINIHNVFIYLLLTIYYVLGRHCAWYLLFIISFNKLHEKVLFYPDSTDEETEA